MRYNSLMKISSIWWSNKATKIWSRNKTRKYTCKDKRNTSRGLESNVIGNCDGVDDRDACVSWSLWCVKLWSGSSQIVRACPQKREGNAPPQPADGVSIGNMAFLWEKKSESFYAVFGYGAASSTRTNDPCLTSRTRSPYFRIFLPSWNS